MGLNIIIDKSTFQSLSYDELVRLDSYYKHNVAPILVMEVIGDLKKEVAEGKTPSDKRVKDFAQKLFPGKTNVNSYYRSLLKQELSGTPCQLDGRPTLDMEKVVQADDGRKGYVIKETEEEKSIYKWKEGKFSEADHELSEMWRTITTQEDLLKNLKTAIKTVKIVKLKSLEELNDFVDAVINNPDFQDKLLAFAIDVYGEDEVEGAKIFEEWLLKGRPLLSTIMPYVVHCLKVDMLFHFGLQNDLIGTRPTNRVDLEYLYYIPFCNIFTSNDKIHKRLAPLLIRKDQKFIMGADLKDDLKSIIEYLAGKKDEELKEFASEPPIIESSLTFKLWKEYYDYPDAWSFKRKVTDEELEEAKKQIDKFERAMKGEPVEFAPGEEEEFIVKQSTISMNDPCLCGSGKRVIDCCIPKEKFIKISKDQREEK